MRVIQRHPALASALLEHLGVLFFCPWYSQVLLLSKWDLL